VARLNRNRQLARTFALRAALFETPIDEIQAFTDAGTLNHPLWRAALEGCDAGRL
jgi:hypothetical protein